MTGGDAIGRREIDGWSIRWSEELAAEWRASGLWLDRTIGEYANELVAREPDRLLIVDGDVELRAGRLWNDASRLADALRRRGIGRGDVVSFMLPNWHEACVVYLAASLIGSVCHPLVTNYRNAELLFMLGDCKSKIIFIPASYRNHDYIAMLGEVRAELEAPPEVCVLRGNAGAFVAYEALIAEGRPGIDFGRVDPNAVRMILYTSGTTGRPKGVLHTHNSINADIVQLQREWNRGTDARYLVASPVSHIGGSLYSFEMPLIFGTSAVLMDPWDPDQAVKLIERWECTHMAGATPFLDLLLKSARKAMTRLPSLRIFICGGASVPPALIRDATQWFENCIATRVYGSTEVPTITVGSLTAGDIDHAAGTDGKIGVAKVRIKSPDASGEGEIYALGPQIMAGFFDVRDELSAFDEDGFYRMGDLGRIVDDQYVVVTGRTKDIIIRNGENISPKEVEDILINHPRIQEIAIVGLPSARTGELACAFVVTDNGEDVAISELAALLADHGVAKFKYPERVVVRTELPRNATGKVLKHVLQNDYAGDLEEKAL